MSSESSLACANEKSKDLFNEVFRSDALWNFEHE